MIVFQTFFCLFALVLFLIILWLDWGYGLLGGRPERERESAILHTTYRICVCVLVCVYVHSM